jgi:hypothetical protein
MSELRRVSILIVIIIVTGHINLLATYLYMCVLVVYMSQHVANRTTQAAICTGSIYVSARY